MAGHSKWANIKHRKGKADAARGKVFSKIAKEIIVAAAAGGGNVDDNIQLRALVQKAKGVSMPKDNIDRAIKKGTGELEGGQLIEGSYEGYAAGGIAVVVKVLTDNKNRSISEVRHAFTKAGANMADQGAVSRMFQRKGQIFIDKEKTDEETLMDLVLEAGAEDVREDGSNFEVICALEDFEAVKAAVEKASIPCIDAEVTMLPQSTTNLAGKRAEQMVRLMEALEDCDDVQKVYTNADIPDDVVERMS